MMEIRNGDNLDTISVDTLALEDTVTKERVNEIAELNALGKKVCNLHSSLLYYRNTKLPQGDSSFKAWQHLVTRIGGTPNTWRDLGYSLGITLSDLDYIMYSKNFDPGDVVLKVFAQNEKATIDKILDVFVKMQRYDILKAVEEPLLDLAQCFIKEDSGYYSQDKSGTKEIISCKTDLLDDIPPALIKKYSGKDKQPNRPNQPRLVPPTSEEKDQKKNNNPILFLTFAKDGISTAYNIKYYVKRWTDVSGVTVITLNDKKDEVFQNPEKFIREYFEKAVFMVPIVTEGYLREIDADNSSAPSTSDHLDCKYVRFIYKLIMYNYVYVSGCRNKKVRSVLPQNIDKNVLRDIMSYPGLIPWTVETNFDEQFKAFIKYSQSI